MTIEELITKLEELDPELEVYMEIGFNSGVVFDPLEKLFTDRPWNDDVEVVILSTEEV